MKNPVRKFDGFLGSGEANASGPKIKVIKVIKVKFLFYRLYKKKGLFGVKKVNYCRQKIILVLFVCFFYV